MKTASRTIFACSLSVLENVRKCGVHEGMLKLCTTFIHACEPHAQLARAGMRRSCRCTHVQRITPTCLFAEVGFLRKGFIEESASWCMAWVDTANDEASYRQIEGQSNPWSKSRDQRKSNSPVHLLNTETQGSAMVCVDVMLQISYSSSQAQDSNTYLVE